MDVLQVKIMLKSFYRFGLNLADKKRSKSQKLGTIAEKWIFLRHIVLF